MPDTAQSWFWWTFSTIFLALLVNLASSYAKPYIDKVLYAFSERKKVKSQKKQEEYDKELNRLLSNPNRFTALQARVVITMVLIIYFFLVASIFTVNVEKSTTNIIGGFGGDDLTKAIVVLISGVFIVDMFNRLRELASLSGDFLKETDPRELNPPLETPSSNEIDD